MNRTAFKKIVIREQKGFYSPIPQQFRHRCRRNLTSRQAKLLRNKRTCSEHEDPRDSESPGQCGARAQNEKEFSAYKMLKYKLWAWDLTVLSFTRFVFYTKQLTYTKFVIGGNIISRNFNNRGIGPFDPTSNISS